MAGQGQWRAAASSLTRAKLGELLDAAADVMSDALGQGGTSFDSLYVNVNGESGYFDRSLDAYGREGEPCRRCGAVMRREKFMNRSSYYCPKCQPRPRVRRCNHAEIDIPARSTRTFAPVCPFGRRKEAMTELWVERTGVRRYTGRSSRGAEVLVGNEDVEGVFTPGELMKIALAACSGMSSDQPLRRRLGDDYKTTIKVSGPADREQERYPLLEETHGGRPVWARPRTRSRGC